MATIQASILFSPIASASLKLTQNRQKHRLSVQKNPILTQRHNRSSTWNTRKEAKPNIEAAEELYNITNMVADRAEMHKNIGIQRDNWNHLLLTSVNSMTVTAATVTALAATCGEGNYSLLALKLSSSILYAAATGILMVMNKIQPSQLAEEQRNASRLFKQLHEQINSKITIRKPTSNDVKDAMERVLAIDRAYPLPLLGAMLDKFPKTVEPAVWWPKEMRNKKESFGGADKRQRNGWSQELEEEMREIAGVMKRKDSAEYMRLSKLVLKVNKVLAISGPWLTGLAAVASTLVGTTWVGSWAVVLGALATVVNTLEHGGQVGMVFEMYRSCAGFFMLMEESIESTLEERDVKERQNGELFETEVALKLGRSLSELKKIASLSFSSSSSSPNSEVTEEFASKLF